MFRNCIVCVPVDNDDASQRGKASKRSADLKGGGLRYTRCFVVYGMLAQSEPSFAIHVFIHVRRFAHYLHDLSVLTMDRLA
jgi:hypothetical protein